MARIDSSRPIAVSINSTKPQFGQLIRPDFHGVGDDEKSQFVEQVEFLMPFRPCAADPTVYVSHGNCKKSARINRRDVLPKTVKLGHLEVDLLDLAGCRQEWGNSLASTAKRFSPKCIYFL